jgi:hypothetical protein
MGAFSKPCQCAIGRPGELSGKLARAVRERIGPFAKLRFSILRDRKGVGDESRCTIDSAALHETSIQFVPAASQSARLAVPLSCLSKC